MSAASKGRPKCVTCGKPLRPNLGREYVRETEEFRPTKFYSYGKAGFFCNGPCSEAYALAFATQRHGPAHTRYAADMPEEEIRRAMGRYVQACARLIRRRKALAQEEAARREGLAPP